MTGRVFGRALKWSCIVVVCMLASWPVLGQHYAYGLLWVDARFRAAIDAIGWRTPSQRSAVRAVMACEGRLTALRVLHWGGVRQSSAVGAPSALGCAAASRDRAAVELLLSLGDDINQPGSVRSPMIRETDRITPRTPLAYAFEVRAFDVAELLLARGAKAEARALHGPSALHLAGTMRCFECLELLARYKADLNLAAPTPPLIAWIDNHPNTAEVTSDLNRLRTLGMHAEVVSLDGTTALHAAARLGSLALVERMLREDIDVNRGDGAGMPALMWAAYSMEASGRADSAEIAERLEVTMALLRRSDRVDGTVRRDQGQPDDAAWRVPPEGWSLARFAAKQPSVRRAVRQLGKSFDYGVAVEGLPAWHGFSADETWTLGQAMNDEELRSAFWIRDTRDGTVSLGLPKLLVQQRLHELMRRAVRLGFLDARVDFHADSMCVLLTAVEEGRGIESIDRDTSKVMSVLLQGGIERFVPYCTPENQIAARSAIKKLRP